MSIIIKEGTTKRDWLKLAGATAETALKSLTFGKDGFAGAAPALFRVLEALRGNDSTDRRAARLILETLSYSIAKTISSTQLSRAPLEAELEAIVEHLLVRVQTLVEQREILLDLSHLENPSSFVLFDDVGARIFHELKLNEPKSTEAQVLAIFQATLAEGLNRVRARSADYFAPVFDILSGPAAQADAKARAWQKYRELLIRRFEDEPLFGEDGPKGIRLGQVYQNLRGFWNEDDEDLSQQSSIVTRSKMTQSVRMLNAIVSEWLDQDDPLDRTRLVSGGPGSGKSTFAKSLAASLSIRPEWRVVFVPLQRLKGTGPLENRINEYFRLQVDEPFDLETAPLLSMGRDGHQNWIVIFDGLDELAKEGTSSESAAQDFASALADLRGRVGDIAVRFLVLGRAPSMQEARRRLGLHGKGTIHVAGMAPFSKVEGYSHRKFSYDDPLKLRELDQRPEFWRRWAIAKDLDTNPPEAMKTVELLDLTNEPLLAYLLILSGYVSERWQEAAENRNRIYQAIFSHIWTREREKPTRIHLNDLGQEGFESLLQALGLAAWRGGGRTGDEATFIIVRDNFMRPDLLARAKAGGAADLSNVALLFYTRKDEEGGRGYEFLHKSFGEYLTARGLFGAFLRWGNQANNPTLDFSASEFLRRWLRLAGPAAVTREILIFLRNEARLWSATQNPASPWEPSRPASEMAARLMDHAIREGLPAHELKTEWREAERQERNGEEALMAVLDSLARAAYPTKLLNGKPSEGGWLCGPIQVPVFCHGYAFADFLRRLSTHPFRDGYYVDIDHFLPLPGALAFSLLSRLSLRGAVMFGVNLVQVDLEAVNFEEAKLIGATFAHSFLGGASFHLAELNYARFTSMTLTGVDFSDADLVRTQFDKDSLATAKLSTSQKKVIIKAKKVRSRH